MSDLDIEEGYSATFKIKIDFGYPKARILFFRNNNLLLNDKKHEICEKNKIRKLIITFYI
jgi:hypothetical protein